MNIVETVKQLAEANYNSAYGCLAMSKSADYRRYMERLARSHGVATVAIVATDDTRDERDPLEPSRERWAALCSPLFVDDDPMDSLDD